MNEAAAVGAEARSTPAPPPEQKGLSLALTVLSRKHPSRVCKEVLVVGEEKG